MALEDAKSEVDGAIAPRRRTGPAFENVFGGVPSFLRRSYAKDLTGVDLAVTGVPFDQAVTNRPGARFGPRAIREASLLQPCDPIWGWDFDPLAEFDVVDHGDLAFDYADVAAFPATLQAHLAGIVGSGAACLMLGGDHFCTLPALKAHAERHGPLALVQFDAHGDDWPDDDMDRIDHGTFVGKAAKLGLIDVDRSVQIGIRTVNEDPCGARVIPADTVHRRAPEDVAAEIAQVVGQGPAYLTFDIDALDPAFAPGTGTPVWGGLASWQAAAILRALKGVPFVGGDVVEVSPPFDPTGATAIAGAHVATEIMCLILAARRAARG